jgi:PKHD-type hydroxylase
MFLEIPDLLTSAELARLHQIAAGARFEDGRRSSPHATNKNNLQIDRADPAHAESAQLLAAALHRHEGFLGFAMPRQIAPPMLARYTPGMHYGVHADAAYFPVGAKGLRSDLSCTIFISAPQTYAGGELAIHLGTRVVTFKGEAGSAIVYPSTTLHEVRPAPSGERLVGLTFIESAIADAARREIIYELDEVAALEGLNMHWDNRTRLQSVRNNLRRMWVDKV